MKKKFWLLGIGIILAASITILFGADFLESKDDEKAASSNSKMNREAVSGMVTEEEMAAFKKEGKNPFGQVKSMEELTDRDYREYIHGMSHQKIKADQKWGFYQINDERVQWLLDGLVLEGKQKELSGYTVYKDILERWLAGDFSKADDDHNAIWTMQGGTIGRATGVLSPEEEQAYINSQR